MNANSHQLFQNRRGWDGEQKSVRQQWKPAPGGGKQRNFPDRACSSFWYRQAWDSDGITSRNQKNEKVGCYASLDTQHRMGAGCCFTRVTSLNCFVLHILGAEQIVSWLVQAYIPIYVFEIIRTQTFFLGGKVKCCMKCIGHSVNKRSCITHHCSPLLTGHLQFIQCWTRHSNNSSDFLLPIMRAPAILLLLRARIKTLIPTYSSRVSAPELLQNVVPTGSICKQGQGLQISIVISQFLDRAVTTGDFWKYNP